MKLKRNQSYQLIGGILIVLIIGLVFMARGDSSRGVRLVEYASAHEAIVYKSPDCGCCNNYVAYLRRSGFEVEAVNTDDVEAIKSEHHIPRHMQSCHTTVVGDYAVEGHVPVEAIDKLLQEQPEFSAIAMPGMPSGSPGMPGAKRGMFTVHGITEDGGTAPFVQL
jgi:hypothetical protein